uniref:Regucalcin n=1 Tax=Crassostrea virginica TaxID=6565 RepID=A0A8B8CRQ6_CRAVI|nr:regucalcin-like isoform X3 [Crassostrea virginica]
MSVECVLKNAAKLHGEGPHWDDVTNTLLYVDHYGKAIHRYNPETNADDKIVLDSTVGFAVPASKGGLIAGVGQCLVHVDWETKKVTKLHQVDQGLETSFNDGKCDPQGRVWAENRSVVIDNSGKSVSEFGYPDGMTFDTKGNIWVAHFLSKKVMCHDPKTGEVLQSIEFPAKRITSCCFGGKNLDELYVTSTDYEVPEEEMKEYPLSGSLFRVKGLGVKGYSANTYEGNVPA